MERDICERSVSESLRVILVKKGMNIHQLAEQMGMASQTLYLKFNNDKFNFKDLDAISKALNLKYRVVFTMDEDNGVDK